MRLGINRPHSALGVTNTDDQRFRRRRSEGPIEEATTIAQTVFGLVETNDRRDNHIGLHRWAIRGDEDIPDTALQRVTGQPNAELKGPAFLDDNRKSNPPTTLDQPEHPVAEIRLTTEWPASRG